MAKARKTKTDEVFDFLNKFAKENPGSPAIGYMYKLYKQNPRITVDELKSAVASGVRVDDSGKVVKLDIAEVPEGLEADAKNADAKNYKGIIDRLFPEYDEKIRAKMLDPDSKYFYQKVPYDELKQRGIANGYVSELKGNATEEEKMAQRAEIGQLMKELDRLAVGNKQKKISEEPLFENDPIRGLLKSLGLDAGYEDIFAGVLNKRLREKAARGEGPTSIGEMDKGDVDAFAGDWLRNTLYALPATGVTGGAIPSMAVAGLGGLVDASAIDNFTDEDLALLDYLTYGGTSAGGQFIAPSGPMLLKGPLYRLRNSGGGRLFKGEGAKLMDEFRDVLLHATGEPVDIAKYGKRGAVLDKIATNIMPELNAAGVQAGTKAKEKFFSSDSKDFELVADEYKKLKSRKPMAVARYESFRDDYDLPEKERLTDDELKLVNQYKNLLFEKGFEQ